MKNSEAEEADNSMPTPADLGWTGWKGAFGNIGIGVLTLFLVADGLPSGWPGHERIDTQIIDPIVYPLGIAQGSWTLFAPEPDHINTYVEGVVTYSDGTQHHWRTQDYSDQGIVFSIIKARHAKAANYFRMDNHQAMWPYLADWVVKDAPDKPGLSKVKVELTRHWWNVPEFHELAEDKAKYTDYPPPRDEYPNHHLYFTKKLQK